ncbi:hypothetical protein FXO37_06401 [Capsicum annuum]|nr:hypothetical protein FXO37_06401 [Capsicum annuum]
MTLEVKVSSSSGTMICANGTSLSFTSMEFAIITGLNYSGRYKDFSWGSLSFEDLTRSLNNRLKAGGKFYLIQGMPLDIQTIAPHPWYEFLMNAMFKDNGKVVFKNIVPTEMALTKHEIPQKDVTEDEHSVDSDDDFQDPPPKKINERSKKKQKMDSSTPVAKKPSGKKQVNIVDAHTQIRTPLHRVVKASVMKTPVFKPIPTQQASSKKKEGKKIARVIFPQVQSKTDSHVVKVAVSKRDRYVEKETFISKKVFYAFREEVRQEFKGVHEEFTRIRQLVKKKFKKMVKAIEHSKQQHEDIEVEAQPMDYPGVETSPQQFSPTVDQNLDENQDGTKGCTDLHPDNTNNEIDSQHLIPDKLLQSINLDYNLSEKIVHHDDQITDDKLDNTKLSDSQFTIPDELLPSLNAYRRESITTHPLATSEEEQIDEHFNDKKSESVVEDHCQNVGSSSKADMYGEVDLVLPDSQDTIPDDLLPSLNVYSSKSIIVHPSANRELQTPIPKLRIRRPSKFKESPYTMKFDSTANLLKVHAKRDCGVYMVTYAECLSYGHKILANEFDPNAFHTRYAALLWDYGTRKQGVNAHSDVEAPLRPPRQSRITSVTEVFDV